MKIGIIDDGLDATHPYFNANGLTYPPGFPKGDASLTTPKVIVQRAFAPASPPWKFATQPFDPTQSFHATHVAGIAAGDHGTNAGSALISGIAPNAYLGNYKALSIPTPDFGLDGNSAEITAAIESAVSDGMDVINLSLGEPEVEPSRDLVVHALEAAAKAGVVPVVAAGNDFNQFGFGSVSSPANAPSAITVAATTASDKIADFSSGGPTPVSLLLKPDVSAPGVAITSSLPPGRGGLWGQLGGTSMASPHVAGGAALLKERHPDWTVAQIKSALVQTGTPVRNSSGREISVLREGGGLINLARADNPLIFAAPTAVTFPVNGGKKVVALTDAGGGPGTWTATAQGQAGSPGVQLHGAAHRHGPRRARSLDEGDRRCALRRRHRLRRAHARHRLAPDPVLARRQSPRARHRAGDEAEGPRALLRDHEGRGAEGGALPVPDGRRRRLPGPEVVYRVRISRLVANFGVAVVSGQAVPHVVFAGDENHLAGYTGLPLALNPYFKSFGESRSVAGVTLPATGAYDVVFDTRSAASAGKFQFRFWENDTRPPKLSVVSSGHGMIVVSATDSGSGVDLRSVSATIDGHSVALHYEHGRMRLHADPGSHELIVIASDYQELKNTEDVAKIKPNTSTLKRTVVVR